MKARVCQFFLRIMTSKVIFRPKSDNTTRNESAGQRKNEWRSSFQNRKSLWEQKSTSQEIPQQKTRPHSLAQVSCKTIFFRYILLAQFLTLNFQCLKVIEKMSVQSQSLWSLLLHQNSSRLFCKLIYKYARHLVTYSKAQKV